MKKQKKPIVLILLLLAGFGGVAYMNRPARGMDDQKQAAQEQAPEKEASVAEDVKKNLNEPMKTMKTAGNRQGRPSDLPSILKVKSTPYKPKPNESATSTQWYAPESARNTPPPK